MRKATKTVISFAVVLIAGLNFIVPAFAQDPFSAIAIGGIGGASGAGLFGSMAGMSGIDISWSPNGADPMDAMWNVLNPDHVYFSGEKHEADPQTYPEDVYDYIIVDLGDWLDAQSDFIINFANAQNVDDNDSGTFINQYFDGLTFTAVCPWPGGGSDTYPGSFNWITMPTNIGQTVTGSYSKATLVITCTSYDGVNIGYTYILYYNSTQVASGQGTLYTPWSTQIGLTYYRNSWGSYFITMWAGEHYQQGTAVNVTASGTAETDTYNWNSGTVNTSVFDGWENAKVKIPHNISGLAPGWTVPDFTNALNDLWDQGLQGQIVIEDTDQPVPPPPVPVPSTPLGEVPFDDWVDLWGQGIYQQLENQSDALDLIGSNGIDAIEELESIDTNTEDLVEVAESIDTNIGIGNGILGGIRSLAQSAVNYLEGIAEHVGELVEEIVEGTETLIAGILNQIPQVFSVIFGPIKQASSIWHYVVEWIQSIGGPFQFIWSMASGTSYYIVLPVYASLAAAVVLAFYKRFGK